MFENQVTLDRVESSMKEEAFSKLQMRNLTQKYLGKQFGLDEKDVGLVFFFFEQIIIVEVSCPEMDFGLFPLDTQSCGLFIKYRGTKNHRVRWNDATLVTNRTMVSAEYELSTAEYPGEDTSDGSKAGFRLIMKRKTTVFIYTYFIPCAVMVVVSWMSFSVGVEAVPGRLGLLLTLLLMLMNHTIVVAKETPHSDRICPLIVWIGISIIFVVVALFEYFVILTMLKFGRNNTNTKVAKYNILLKI